jgi:hypothetical protein
MTFENGQSEIMLRVNMWIVQSDFCAILLRRKRPAQVGSFVLESSSSSSSSAVAYSDYSPQAQHVNDFAQYLDECEIVHSRRHPGAPWINAVHPLFPL